MRDSTRLIRSELYVNSQVHFIGAHERGTDRHSDLTLVSIQTHDASRLYVSEYGNETGGSLSMNGDFHVTLG